MMARIRVPGSVDRDPRKPDLGELGQHGARTSDVQAVEVGARRAGEPAQELEVSPDTIVELTLDTGARFYHRYDQLVADLPAGGTRGVADPDTLDLPVVLPGPVTRDGAAGTVIEKVRTFDLDLSGLGDFAGGLAGKPLAQKFDDWRAANFGLPSPVNSPRSSPRSTPMRSCSPPGRPTACRNSRRPSPPGARLSSCRTFRAYSPTRQRWWPRRSAISAGRPPR
jgi:hypothetical protein